MENIGNWPIIRIIPGTAFVWVNTIQKQMRIASSMATIWNALIHLWMYRLKRRSYTMITDPIRKTITTILLWFGWLVISKYPVLCSQFVFQRVIWSVDWTKESDWLWLVGVRPICVSPTLNEFDFAEARWLFLSFLQLKRNTASFWARSNWKSDFLSLD